MINALYTQYNMYSHNCTPEHKHHYQGKGRGRGREGGRGGGREGRREEGGEEGGREGRREGGREGGEEKGLVMEDKNAYYTNIIPCTQTEVIPFVWKNDNCGDMQLVCGVCICIATCMWCVYVLCACIMH